MFVYLSRVVPSRNLALRTHLNDRVTLHSRIHSVSKIRQRHTNSRCKERWKFKNLHCEKWEHFKRPNCGGIPDITCKKCKSSLHTLVLGSVTWGLGTPRGPF